MTSYQETSGDHCDVTTQRNQEEALEYGQSPSQPSYAGQQAPQTGYQTSPPGSRGPHKHHRTAPEGLVYQQPHSHQHLKETQSTPNLGQMQHPQTTQRHVSYQTGSNMPHSAQQHPFPLQGNYQYPNQSYDQQQYWEDLRRQPEAMPRPHAGVQNDPRQQANVRLRPHAEQQIKHIQHQQFNVHTRPQHQVTQEIVTGLVPPYLQRRAANQPPPPNDSSRPLYNQSTTTPLTGPPDNQPATIPSTASEGNPRGRPMYVGFNVSSAPTDVPDSPDPVSQPLPQGNSPRATRTEQPPGTNSPYTRRGQNDPNNQQLLQRRATQNITSGVRAMNIGSTVPNLEYSQAPASQQQPPGNAWQHEQNHGQFQPLKRYNNSNSEQYTEGGGQYPPDQGQWASTENQTLPTGDFSSGNVLTNSTFYGAQTSFASSTTSESTLESSLYGDPTSSFASTTSSNMSVPPAPGGVDKQSPIDVSGSHSLTKHQQHGYESPPKTSEELKSATTSESMSTSFIREWSSDLPTSVTHSKEHAAQYGASPGSQVPPKAMTSPHPIGNPPNSASTPKEFYGDSPDLIMRRSMQSQISNQTRDYIHRQQNTLPAKTMKSQQNVASRTIPEVIETASLAHTESALPLLQKITESTPLDPNPDQNSQPASFNSTSSNHTGVAIPCSSLASSISEHQEQLPFNQKLASSSDTQESVKLKPSHYNPPYVSKPFIPPGEEYNQNEIIHKEPISSASSLQHENEHPIRYQEGLSYTPSEAGGSTEHGQCTSLAPTDESPQQPVMDYQAANLPEGEPTGGETTQDGTV